MALPEDGSLRARVAALEQQLAELQRSDRLIAASIASGKLRSSNFDAGSTGWQVDGLGNAEFNALTLREGIVDLEALVGRAEPAVRHAFLDDNTPDATESVAIAVTPPSWATDASVIAIGSIFLTGTVGLGGSSAGYFVDITIEGDTSELVTEVVDQATGAATGSLSYGRDLDVSADITGDLNVSFDADVANNGNANLVRMWLTVMIVWSR